MKGIIMLTINEAVAELKKVLPEDVVSTASEVDEYFVFSTRPYNTPFGVATGTVGYFVHKKTGAVSPRSIFDSAISKSKIRIDYDPITLKPE